MAVQQLGTFYGVSVGPGDPELITVKALRALGACPVIAVPRTRGENALALSIAQGAVDLSQKEIVYLDFLMSTDEDALAQNRAGHAAVIASRLERGEDVAMLSLGDISTFSTFSYLQALLEDRFPVRVIPGVTSYCAAAAVLGKSLTVQDQPLTIIPASRTSMDSSLALPGTKVLMKSASSLKEVIEELDARGLAKRASLVQNCGLANQKVFDDIRDENIQAEYFTVVLVGA